MANKELGEGWPVVALVRDLLFASRVRGVAPDAVVGHNATVLKRVSPSTRLLVVDLEAAAAQDVIRGGLEQGVRRVVAFAPHVREDAMAEAREAGAEVLPRGAFVKRLPELVRAARTGA